MKLEVQWEETRLHTAQTYVDEAEIREWAELSPENPIPIDTIKEYLLAGVDEDWGQWNHSTNAPITDSRLDSVQVMES